MREQTTRQKIVSLLEERPSARPTAISMALGDDGIKLSPDEVVDEVTEIQRNRSDVMATPPTCRECGFSRFDNLLNIPSKCPDCRSEWIEEPVYTIEP